MTTTKSTTGIQTDKPKQRNYTHWLTRDLIDGVVSRSVKIWLQRPNRGDDGRWFAEKGDAFYGEWIVDEIQQRTYPDDDRQCIRVECDAEWHPGDSVNRPNRN